MAAFLRIFTVFIIVLVEPKRVSSQSVSERITQKLSFDGVSLHLLPLANLAASQHIGPATVPLAYYIEVEVGNRFYPIVADKNQPWATNFVGMICRETHQSCNSDQMSPNLTPSLTWNALLTATKLSCANTEFRSKSLNGCALQPSQKATIDTVLVFSCVGNTTSCTGSYICPRGYAWLAKNSTCASCGSNCAQCTSNFAGLSCSACIHATSEYPPRRVYMAKSGDCVTHSQCPLGQYGNTRNGTCERCADACQTCLEGFNGVFCTSCERGKALSNFECVGTCPGQTYNKTQRGASVCVADCGEGMYKNMTNKQCTPCPSGCSHCQVTIATKLNCTGCYSPLFLESGRCVKACQDGVERGADPTVQLWGTDSELVGNVRMWINKTWQGLCVGENDDEADFAQQICSRLRLGRSLHPLFDGATSDLQDRDDCDGKKRKKNFWVRCSGPSRAKTCGQREGDTLPSMSNTGKY